MRNYTWIVDAGHAWLSVPQRDLTLSGFQPSDFTAYSYHDAANVYLECDCDAEKFLASLTDRGIKVATVHRDEGDRSTIRDKARIRSRVAS